MGTLRDMFFDSWIDIGRVVVVGVAAYLLLILVIRVSGKRTLAKMNAFDLVVTVALGSTLATVLLSTDVSLSEGATALVLLIAAQFVVAWSTVNAAIVRRAVKSNSTLLLWQGRILSDALTRQRVTEGEVRQAIRSQGLGGLEKVAAVILETDGSFSVIPADKAGTLNALSDVPGLPKRSGTYSGLRSVGRDG